MQKYLFFLMLFALPEFASGDTGRRFDLKNSRNQILKAIENEQPADTGRKALNDYSQRLKLLSDSIVKIDNEIFVSYDVTISRISRSSTMERGTGRILVGLCFLFAVLALVALYFVYFANEQMNKTAGAKKKFSEALREVGFSILVLFFPAGERKGNFTGLHKILVLLLLMMLASFVGYFISMMGW